MEQRISLITLGVADVAKSAAFYEALGWRQVDSPDGIVAFDLIGQTLGLYPIAKLAEDIGVGLSAKSEFSGITMSHNLSEKDAVDALMAAAQAAGARILRPASDIFWGGYIGYFADPDGHIWEAAWNPFSPLGPNGEFQWNGAA